MAQHGCLPRLAFCAAAGCSPGQPFGAYWSPGAIPGLVRALSRWRLPFFAGAHFPQPRCNPFYACANRAGSLRQKSPVGWRIPLLGRAGKPSPPTAAVRRHGAARSWTSLLSASGVGYKSTWVAALIPFGTRQHFYLNHPWTIGGSVIHSDDAHCHPQYKTPESTTLVHNTRVYLSRV